MDEMIKENADLFFYWMNERHRIYLRKETGDPWPWTADPILQKYKFTNVYRNYDAVTKELHRLCRFEHYRKTKKSGDAMALLLFRIVLFRMFNLPGTYLRLHERGLTSVWKKSVAKALLHRVAKSKKQVFTGAYIITNNGSNEPKIDLVCNAVTHVWQARKALYYDIYEVGNLEQACKYMTEYPMIGSFIAYEMVTDFRWTPILSHAGDIMDWANPGPGARRGLSRIWYDDPHHKGTTRSCIDRMKDLLKLSQKRGKLKNHMEPLEMRDIEHSLCEFDKYMRVRNGEGRPRSIYKPNKLSQSVRQTLEDV